MVGFFRNSGPRRSNNDWMLESTNDGEKKMFLEEMANRQLDINGTVPLTINCDTSPTPITDESDTNKALSLKVHLLEQQLNEKDETISNLRQALEREDDRVTRLELQVGTIIELSCAGQKTVMDRTASAPNLSKLSSRQDFDAKLEISALQELLTRVMAEKDRVQHENLTLRGLMKKTYNRPPRGDDPHRLTKSVNDCRTFHIDELDLPPKESEGLPRPSSQVDTTFKERRVDINTKESKPSFPYQMSSRDCHASHSHIPYSSTFATDNDAQKELPKVLKEHFRQVWQIVQQHENTDDTDSISSSANEDEWVKKGMHTNFPSSSFARHLAKQCKYLENEKAVLKWCMKNVRVQMQKNVM